MDAAASEDGDDHLFISLPRSVRDLTAKSAKTARGRTTVACHGRVRRLLRVTGAIFGYFAINL